MAAVTFLNSSEAAGLNGISFNVSLSSQIQVNDTVIVAVSLTRAGSLGNVYSSDGTLYEQILPVVANGNLQFSVSRRIITSTTETILTCSGSNNAQDGQSAVAMCFRGADIYALDTTVGSTIGTSVTPDSPSVTTVSSNAVIISAVGSLVADAAVTAPTSFINQVDISASDTRSSTTGMAMVTLTSAGAFNPASWTNFTSAAWVAATIALRPASTFTGQPMPFDSGKDLMLDARKVVMIGYGIV